MTKIQISTRLQAIFKQINDSYQSWYGKSKALIQEAYRVATEEEDYTPLEARKLIYDNLRQISERTIRKYLPDEAKNLSKQRFAEDLPQPGFKQATNQQNVSNNLAISAESKSNESNTIPRPNPNTRIRSHDDNMCTTMRYAKEQIKVYAEELRMLKTVDDLVVRLTGLDMAGQGAIIGSDGNAARMKLAERTKTYRQSMITKMDDGDIQHNIDHFATLLRIGESFVDELRNAKESRKRTAELTSV